MRTSGGTARRLARAWGPELLTAALLTAIAFAGQRDDPLFAIFMGIAGAIFWYMGFRHRQTPLHAKVGRVQDTVDDIRDMLVQDDHDVQDGQGARNTTHLRVIR